jgi:glycerol-1-phosphate dehydrogenase [NAD(P)+]
MKHFLDITTHASAEARINAISKHSLVIYSPTSLRRLKNVRGKGVFVSTHEVGKDAAKLEELCARLDIDTVIGFGGGTAIDIAKYVARISRSKFVCIPTMLSTNAFATNKVALQINGPKVTLDAKLADEIILDENLVTAAGMHNLYGLCDILSIHTALYDWRLAANAGVESISYDIYEKADGLLEKAISFALNTPNLHKPDITFLFSMIGESGHITNLYGCGRPESGSEHIFAKELERRADVPHGISIATGIMLMSHIQGNSSDDVQAALRRIGVFADLAREYDLRTLIGMSLENLRPRKDRYTILDESSMSPKECMELVDLFYAEIAEKTYEYSHR